MCSSYGEFELKRVITKEQKSRKNQYLVRSHPQNLSQFINYSRLSLLQHVQEIEIYYESLN